MGKAANRISKKKNSILKSIWFWLLVVGIIAFATNIGLSILFRGTDGANIFTAVSGWVSGIATVLLGIIAVVQTRKYKEDGDENIQKQYDFEVFKLIVSQREQFVVKTKEMLENFVFDYDYKRAIFLIEEIGTLYHPEYRNVRAIELRSELNVFYKELDLKVTQILIQINKDVVQSNEKIELIQAINNYKNLILRDQNFDAKFAQSTVLAIRTNLAKPHEKLLNSSNKYIEKLDRDLFDSIVEKSSDLEYIKLHYKQNEEQNNG